MLSLERQTELHDAWLTERAQTVLPMLMKRADVDMWLLISREYNEDPVLNTMLPGKWMGARRTTMLLIYDPGNGQPLETLAPAMTWAMCLKRPGTPKLSPTSGRR